MEQNNFNNQGVTATEPREPLPTFDTQPVNNFTYSNATESAPVFSYQTTNNYNYGNTNTQKEPLPQADYFAKTPVFTPTEDLSKKTNPEVDAIAESAFSKSLIAVILAWFPICSIVSIFMGMSGLNLAKQANSMATDYGVRVSGKARTAKMLGTIGFAAGIIETITYVLSLIGALCYAIFMIVIYGMMYM
ncbi:MAG: hypothetical protein IIW72_02920 [Clostridia bacterium]|nr:hypothetical protein [Clostridia bacterium]